MNKLLDNLKNCTDVQVESVFVNSLGENKFTTPRGLESVERIRLYVMNEKRIFQSFKNYSFLELNNSINEYKLVISNLESFMLMIELDYSNLKDYNNLTKLIAVIKSYLEFKKALLSKIEDKAKSINLLVDRLKSTKDFKYYQLAKIKLYKKPTKKMVLLDNLLYRYLTKFKQSASYRLSIDSLLSCTELVFKDDDNGDYFNNNQVITLVDIANLIKFYAYSGKAFLGIRATKKGGYSLENVASDITSFEDFYSISTQKEIDEAKKEIDSITSEAMNEDADAKKTKKETKKETKDAYLCALKDIKNIMSLNTSDKEKLEQIEKVLEIC